MLRDWYANVFIDNFNRVNDGNDLRMINILDIRSRLCRYRADRRTVRRIRIITHLNQLPSVELMTSYERVKHHACTFVPHLL